MSNILYVSLQISPEDTEMLKEMIIKNGLTDYKIKRNSKDLGHVTLCYHSDFKSLELFEQFVENYKEDKYNIIIDSIVHDKHCVALTVKSSVKFYPEDKNLHITMMLNGKPPVYSNTLINGSPNIIKINPIPLLCPIKINKKHV